MIRNAIMKSIIRLMRRRVDAKNYILLRKAFEKYTKRFRTIPDGADMQSVNAGGVSAEMISWREYDEGRIVLYLHGGAYVIGSPRTHRDLILRIARRCRARVLTIDYRLAPENPHPAALEDALAAYRWLIETGSDPKRIVIMGDSAGGGLTLALIMALRDSGDPMPACAVCLSPWTDLTVSGESMKTHRRKDPLLDPEYIQYYARLYASENDAAKPYVSPLFGDFRALPPLLIHVGGAEVLLDDSLRVAEKASSAGVLVELKVWPGMIHVFQALAAVLPDSRRALREIGEFTAKCIPVASSDPS